MISNNNNNILNEEENNNNNTNNTHNVICLDKPVIHIYSPVRQQVIVEVRALQRTSKITQTYPTPSVVGLNETTPYVRWACKVQPCDTYCHHMLTVGDYQTPYLFWEGTRDVMDFNTILWNNHNDYIIVRKDAYELALRKFFLLANDMYEPLEVAEFLTFCLPKMSQFEFVQLWKGDDILCNSFALNVIPPPEKLTRMFMLWKGIHPSDYYIDLNDVDSNIVITPTNELKQDIKNAEKQYEANRVQRNKQYRVVEWGTMQLAC